MAEDEEEDPHRKAFFLPLKHREETNEDLGDAFRNSAERMLL
jgi:hypothetical protein